MVVDSNTVLWGQTIIYTAYCLVILAVIGWFAMKITRPVDAPPPVKPAIFYGFVAFLTLTGVSLHLITYNTIPWVPDDLNAREAGRDAPAFTFVIKDHQFFHDGHALPAVVPAAQQIPVPCGQLVKFSVTTEDNTYGFGLFRANNSMVMQMQVIPGHDNVLVWTFVKNGTYTIRSTEYSGPAGNNLQAKDAIVVSGCAQEE